MSDIYCSCGRDFEAEPWSECKCPHCGKAWEWDEDYDAESGDSFVYPIPVGLYDGRSHDRQAQGADSD